MSRRRAAVLIGVHVLIALHIVHWLSTGNSMTPLEPSEAMAFSKGSVVNAGLLFFGAMILLTAVFGRFFCGWGCHLVALQDLCRWLLEKVGIRPKPLRSRLLIWVPVVAFVYMFLWPLAYRLWIGDPLAPIGRELETSEFWATFPGWVVGGLTFLICGFACVYFLGAKGFCTYGCPYGAAFGAVERLSPLRIRVTDACAGCGHCTAVCTSNVRVHEEVRDYGMVVDPGCMKCMDCVSVCPNDALYYGAGPLPIQVGAKPAGGSKASLSWGEEGLLAGAFIAAFLAFRGLYGAVPFLLSLGWSAILASGALLAWHLVSRPSLSFRRFALKRQGRLLPGGISAAVILALVGLFWAHSAVVRSQEMLTDRGFAQLSPLRTRTLDPTSSAMASGKERRTARQALKALDRSRRWGLLKKPGTFAKAAWLQAFAGFWEEVPGEAQAALDRGEETSSMHQLLARQSLLQGNLPRAVEHYRQAASTSPSALAAKHLGLVLAEAGDLDGAEASFEEAARRAPQAPQILYNLALIRALKGNADQAINLFHRVLDLDPQHLEARENLAGVLAGAGRFEESVEQFREAVSLSPDDPETVYC